MRSSIHWKRGRRKVKSRMSSLHHASFHFAHVPPSGSESGSEDFHNPVSEVPHSGSRTYVKSTRHPLSNLFPYRSQLPGGKLLPVGSLGQYGILFWYTERDSLEVFLAVVSTFGPQSCSGLASLNLRKSRVGLSEKLKFTSQLRSIMRLTTVIDSPR